MKFQQNFERWKIDGETVSDLAEKRRIKVKLSH